MMIQKTHPALDAQADALLIRLGYKPTRQNPRAHEYRAMTLLEMGRELLALGGRSTRGMDRMQLAGELLTQRAAGPNGSTDFQNLIANVANKRLRIAYDENPGTYQLWARRAANAPDFREIKTVHLSGAPDLLQTNEAGEFKYGSMTDSGETYKVLTYGRIVALTRQAIVNDDLRAFDRMVTAFGFAARRLENRLVYAQLTGTDPMADGLPVFDAGHNNTGANPLSITSLASGRAAMRLQKGLQGEDLDIAPAYLIVPATLEQTAYSLTSSQYVPASVGEINEFRTGGRTSLVPVVEPLLNSTSASAWYLAASSGQVDTVEYCYLDGAEGPMIEQQTDFDNDSVSFKCRLDFAAKAIDYRGLYRGNV